MKTFPSSVTVPSSTLPTPLVPPLTQNTWQYVTQGIIDLQYLVIKLVLISSSIIDNVRQFWRTIIYKNDHHALNLGQESKNMIRSWL